MIHREEMLDSLDEFMKKNRKSPLSPDELYNKWIQETGFPVHDAETARYVLRLFPVIEEAKKYPITIQM